jgi:hypothetical protein
LSETTGDVGGGSEEHFADGNERKEKKKKNAKFLEFKCRRVSKETLVSSGVVGCRMALDSWKESTTIRKEGIYMDLDSILF